MFYKKCHFTTDVQDDSEDLANYVYCYERLGSRRGGILNSDVLSMKRTI